MKQAYLKQVYVPRIVGMIPEVPVEIITFVRNIPIAGAKMPLTSLDARKEAEAIGEKVRYIEL